MNEGVVYRPELAESPSRSIRPQETSGLRARLTAKDMDALMFYDHFTPVLPALALRPTASSPWVRPRTSSRAGHNIRFDGMLPTNTHGGNHSEAYIHGLTHPQEAVRLIRGTSTSQPPSKQINRVLSCSSVAQLSAAVIIRRG